MTHVFVHGNPEVDANSLSSASSTAIQQLVVEPPGIGRGFPIRTPRHRHPGGR
ncbi:hypothetical protein [uncultured Ilumatobacter sp.]|uniref:hypothetical protein n=1 Tax=uncultured Ilumatobacter sp. TaxID=879968 RepID=UPI00374EEC0E